MPWVDCYKAVASRFSDLKKIARKFYVGKTEKEILMLLGKYTTEDLIQAFEIDKP